MNTSDDAQVSSDRRVGQRIGDYLLEALIGRGGMGVVFRASHVVSGDIVALKLMAPDLADNAIFRDRFIREAEAGPNLLHPNIVRVLGSGEAGGELFIAMELIEGTDLKGVIQQDGPLDPRRALSIFRQAASALDAAHESGMVHRDVKPQNILVIPRSGSDSTDRVYLTDFGLVRPVASESSATRTGQVFGSVAYMAPELIEGVPADGRADVYALACVVYESLTGSVPFERENEVSAVWAHIHEDPPFLTDTRRDLPGGLNDVVFKAMAKHPDDRFLTCGEFVAELELGLGRKLSAMKHSHVRPLVARIPRRKTERDVWAPNFFPELSRVRAASRERFDWRKGVALIAAALLLSSIQVGRDGGIPRAIADVADAADSAVDSAVAAVIDPDPQPVEA
ncbi:MAG: serine/threonine protein kinase, partial [Actinomycetota bacterium]|nr:serine/threonine protein kinase [Actinomycetota bacterium]